MVVQNNNDLEGLKAIGRIVRKALDVMQAAVQPGITTGELDLIGGRVLAENGAASAPRSVYDFPGETCISVNDIAAHGIPGDVTLVEGDLVNIDVSAEKNGYFADSGRSIPVGNVTDELLQLCDTTRKAQQQGMMAAKAGRPINSIGKAVEDFARKRGYKIIQSLAGHGIGRSIHEAPTVFNHYEREHNIRLREGLVLTVEPFLTKGQPEIFEDSDGWSLRTVDGTIPAQFEHTFVVTKGRPIVVT